MTEVQTPPGVKSGKALRIALAISVAINLAVAGMVGGAALRHGGMGGRDGGVREIGFGPFTEALNRDDRAALRKAFLAKAPQLRQMRQQLRADAQALLMVLRAEPFDPAGLATVMESQRARMAGQLELGQALLRDFVIAMNPEDRRAFAARLEDGLLHGKGKAAP